MSPATPAFSVSTVSRVLRGHVDVGEATRDRVQASIDRLGYRPSPIARALVRGESRLLALLVSDLTNPFYPQLAASIEAAAAKAGYTLVICSTGDRTETTRKHLQRLLDQGIDGVIHAATGLDEQVVLEAFGDPRRIVFTNRPPASDTVSSVVSDNYAGAVELTEHLVTLGHTRIGFIGGPAHAANAVERLRGFRSVVEANPQLEPFVSEGPFARETGEAAVSAWMDRAHSPTAIIGINDAVALGAMEELIRRGLKIPESVALAGFDGTQLAASPALSLTSVDQHSDRMGRLAIRILLRQLAMPSYRPVRRVLPTQLLLRHSTEGVSPLVSST